MAVGIDFGTGNLIAVRQEDDKIEVRQERNAFIYIGKWDSVKNKLKRTEIPYTRVEDKVYIVGTAAYDYANVFGDVPLRRPMSLGMLNPNEKDALPIMRELAKSLLGDPQTEEEICAYVTPSEPIDAESHTVYHEDVVKAIVEDLGYTAKNIRESVALAYTGLVDEDLTGCVISFGAGMANTAVMFRGMDALTFSVTKSGDYIDQQASRETSTPIAHITAIKEGEEFTIDPAVQAPSRETMAIASYYRFIIRNILSQIAHLFTTSKDMPKFKEPIKIVCGGGTSQVDGFIELFKSEFEKLEFPIDVKSFEVVEEPLLAVAKGALSEAQLEEEE
jgi:hypothetical protein